MMQWYMQFFSLVLCLLMTQHVCQASSGCPTPTEDKEISICSYCSDSRAGVRWAVHPSTLNKYPDGPYRLIISFRCNHTQNMIDITEDACFNGDFIRRLIYLTEPSVWRWHILGQRLPKGTQCQFTTTVRDGETRPMPRLQMSTSCTIGSNNSSPVMPATCLSESPPLGCPCQCSDGFKIDERGDVTDSLICRNIDECSEGSHNCINASDCVDTDGGHSCSSGTTTTMKTTTDTTTMEPMTKTTTMKAMTDTTTMEPTTETTTMKTTTDPTTMEPTTKTTTMKAMTDTTTMEPTAKTAGSISTINTEIMSSIASTMVTPNSITSLSVTTTYGTEITTTESLMATTGTETKTPNELILGIVLGIVLFVVFVTIVMIISITVTQKNYFHLQRKRLNSKITKFPQGLAVDSFDPKFCPVAIEKIPTETMSFKSIFDPPYYGQHDALPPSTSGSASTLHIDKMNCS